MATTVKTVCDTCGAEVEQAGDALPPGWMKIDYALKITIGDSGSPPGSGGYSLEATYCSVDCVRFGAHAYTVKTIAESVESASQEIRRHRFDAQSPLRRVR